MAFTASTLTLVSAGNASTPRLWTYSTADDITDLDVNDYWANEPQGLRAGDVITANCADGWVTLGVTSASTTASVVAAIGSGGNGGQVWVQANCTGYGTAGAVGYALAPIAGTIVKFKHVLTTVVDADVILNLDVGGTNCTGSVTIAVAAVAVGDTDAVAVTANNTVTENQLIKVESDGGGTAGAGTVFILIQP